LKLLNCSERISILYAEYGYLEVDGHAVVLRQGDSFTHFPVGSTTVIFIEPGTVVTHAAVKACAESGCLLLWVGEGGVRCYSAGNPGGAVADKLLHQAKIRLDESLRLNAARKIFFLMFGEYPPLNRSVDQIRGIEGSKVRKIYAELSERNGIIWAGRDQTKALSDELNIAISGANAALYGVAEAIILALGYSPSIGFVHSGDERSFVFDVADTVKFSTVVPLAFSMYSDGSIKNTSSVRHACRDVFRDSNVIKSIVENIYFILE